MEPTCIGCRTCTHRIHGSNNKARRVQNNSRSNGFLRSGHNSMAHVHARRNGQLHGSILLRRRLLPSRILPARIPSCNSTISTSRIHYAPHGGALTNTLTSTFNATQDCYYEPSQTAAYTLVVQQNPVPSWQPSPLPVAGQYWSRPISPDNREWWVIGGNDPDWEVGGGTGTPGWPAGTNVYTSNFAQYQYVPYTTGPTSAHIVWRRQGSLDGIQGGIIDGAATLYQAPDLDYVGNPYDHGEPGPNRYGNPIMVFQGRCYNTRTAVFNGVPQSVWECYDIQTGQIYWDQPTSQITAGTVSCVPTLMSYTVIAPAVPGATNRADQIVATLVYVSLSAVAGTGLVVKYDPITGLYSKIRPYRLHQASFMLILSSCRCKR